MIPQVHPNETSETNEIIQTGDTQPVLAQEAPPVAEPTGAASDAGESPSTPQTVIPERIPSASPPTPPRYPPVAPPRRGPSAGRWTWSIGLVVIGGLAWWIYGFVLGAVGFSLSGGRDVFSILVSTLVAAVPALTCLVAGWLLHSWPGMIVAALVYVAASALMWMLAAVGDLVTAEFALYVVLPAVVLSAIGTIIGRATAGRRG
jgi:hypothetical protein